MPVDINALARLGAQTRINELIAEIESLVEAFPGLGKAPARTARAAESEPPAPRKRRKMSAATKAKLRASWARRRARSSEAPEAAATEQVGRSGSPRKKATHDIRRRQGQDRGGTEEALGGIADGEEEEGLTDSVSTVWERPSPAGIPRPL